MMVLPLQVGAKDEISRVRLKCEYNSCGGLVAWLERSTPIREIVSSNPRRGYTPVSAQVWHGVTPSGRDPWLGWGTYIPCNPSVWEAELSH